MGSDTDRVRSASKAMHDLLDTMGRCGADREKAERQRDADELEPGGSPSAFEGARGMFFLLSHRYPVA